MRSAIIVTVKSNDRVLTYDVEVPTDLTAGKAAKDIVEALNYYKGGTASLPESGYCLKNERTGRRLSEKKTLAQNGVWQGDVLLIVPV